MYDSVLLTIAATQNQFLKIPNHFYDEAGVVKVLSEDITETQCMAECLADDKCYAFDYDHSNFDCNKIHKTITVPSHLTSSPSSSHFLMSCKYNDNKFLLTYTESCQ